MVSHATAILARGDQPHAFNLQTMLLLGDPNKPERLAINRHAPPFLRDAGREHH
jgi:hypothetical protein